MDEQIALAWEKRAELVGRTDLDCFRVFHGYTEGAPGIEIDAYGQVAVIRYGEERKAEVPDMARVLTDHCGFASVVAKERKGQAEVISGCAPAKTTFVIENGIRFAVELDQPRNPGLYLDARPAREWLRHNSRGRRILNLFSFTGSLGLAASLGGATRVTHVDLQRRALERCRENYQANGLRLDSRDTVRGNAYQHMRRAASSRQVFDGVVIDVPPGHHRGSPSSLAGLLALAPHVASMLSPEGWLLCFFHRTHEAHEELEAGVAAAAGVAMKSLWRGVSGIDFPEQDPTRKLRLSALAPAN